MSQDIPNKPLVLIIEMDPMCARVIERILKGMCTIINACTYDEVIKLLNENEFNTLYVDNDFPDPGVIELFKVSREISPKTKRILMTGENVVNLQDYLKSGLVSSYVTRNTSNKVIAHEIRSPIVDNT